MKTMGKHEARHLVLPAIRLQVIYYPVDALSTPAPGQILFDFRLQVSFSVGAHQSFQSLHIHATHEKTGTSKIVNQRCPDAYAEPKVSEANSMSGKWSGRT